MNNLQLKTKFVNSEQIHSGRTGDGAVADSAAAAPREQQQLFVAAAAQIAVL